MNDELLKAAHIECLCGRWVSLVVDDRGAGRVFHWAPDDQTLVETPGLPTITHGTLSRCPCGRVYRALEEEPWIEETPLKEGLDYRVSLASEVQPEPDWADWLRFVGIDGNGRARFSDSHEEYVLEANHIRDLEQRPENK